MDDELTFRRLEMFVRVAELGSLRATAEEVHISQPALSQHLKTLEKVFAIQLFERGQSGSRITSAGRQLLPRVRQLLENVERLIEFSRNLREGKEGVVSIACYPVHIERFLARVMSEFIDAYPNIRLDLTKLRDDRRRHAGRSLFEELIVGDVDLAMGPPHRQLGLEGIKAYDAKISVLLPASHPLHANAQVPIDVLRDLPLLIAPPLFFSRTRVQEAAEEAGFRLRVAAESSSPPALFALGQAGVGIPVLPDDYSIVSSRGPHYPVLVDNRGMELSTPVWLQWRPNEEVAPPVATFISLGQKWAAREAREPGTATLGL